MRKMIRPFHRPSRQRGAALFVGLMLLILLALIGIAGMQTSTLQERMAGNYRTQVLAFQNAETEVRRAEREILRTVNANGVYLADAVDCGLSPAATAASGWTPATLTGGRQFVIEQSACTPGWSTPEVGLIENDKIDPLYVVAAAATDRPANATAISVIETVYIP
jgi:type IV pilus assembly protein PilX